ncbi:sialate O-acetylesterase [candidate division KSB1 bacterium]|nr:sialate O-acetylesterase [candidate division KSB1 bacterium]
MSKFPLLFFIAIVLIQSGCNQNKQVDPRTTNFPKLREAIGEIPTKNATWVFIMAGQSNMAGRGFVEPRDTVAHEKVLTIDKEGRVVFAKEPLHTYEPELTGLDCGLSFGKSLVDQLPDSIYLLLLPTAVGGSAINQWLSDANHRNVQLLDNFIEKVEIGKKYGILKGILWHQGESDANLKSLPYYEERLDALFKTFRSFAENDSLPILIGELGSYSNRPQEWEEINKAINAYAKTDVFSAVIKTGDLTHRGDEVHFNAHGQRAIGKRFAEAFLLKFK